MEFCGYSDGHVWKQMNPPKEMNLELLQPPEINSTLDEVFDVDDNTVVSFSIKFYYTPEFAAGTGDIDGYLDLLIAEANQGFVNSNIKAKVILKFNSV